jgi:hypothetical protein
MRTLQDTNGSDSCSETSGQDRDFTAAFTGKDEYQEIVKRAESFPLEKIFKIYKINIDSYNKKTACPFHKGGRETTASFYFYPETNTFWCFGCKTGTTCVDFVSKIEKTNKMQAALKILNNFNADGSQNLSIQEYGESFKEKSDLLFSFSKSMREAILRDKSLLPKLEKIYFIFDKMNDKYELDSKALASLIDKLNLKIEKNI